MRYFLEVSYKGTRYSGFQVQQNANTVQAEVEKAFSILQREAVSMTGSSRTDAGVHALQNYFHFDFEAPLHEQFVYKINAILPADVVVKRVFPVDAQAHCRFDALSREYRYYLYRQKDPFREDRAYYFPYRLDRSIMEEAAAVLKEYEDFSTFSKRNTQVKSFRCRLMESEWHWEEDQFVYRVKADRFLRGMVRALVGTMLKLGRHRITIDEFRSIITSRDCTKASFAVPGKGLFLHAVDLPAARGGL